MPPWFYQAVMTVETVGLYKTAEKDPEKIRPIGMRNPFFKTVHKPQGDHQPEQGSISAVP